jgi:hypothetical protein
MPTTHFRDSLYAGMLLCPVLLAFTPAFALQIYLSADQPKSIISLAPSPKPQGESLAHRIGDSRFGNPPANYHVFAAATVGSPARTSRATIKDGRGRTIRTCWEYSHLRRSPIFTTRRGAAA